MKLESSKCANTKFHKIHSVGAELFNADGQTDMTKLTVAFRNSVNASKNNASTTQGTPLFSLSVTLQRVKHREQASVDHFVVILKKSSAPQKFYMLDLF